MTNNRAIVKTGLLQHNRNYRNLWLAETGSNLGDWFNQVALAQTTLVLTGSAAAMGWVLLCRALPGIFLGPFVSPMVDRFSKRSILYATDLVRAVLALSFAFAIFYKMSWLLYVGSVLIGISGVLFTPARTASIPFVVARSELAEANALASGAYGVVSIIGAVLGGVAASVFSPLVCFVINSLSYLWSALCIRQAQWQETATASAERPSYFAALRAGFREASRNKTVRSIILIGVSWGIVGGGYYVMVPLLGNNVYNMGGLGIGLLYAIDGLGVTSGAYLVKRFIGTHHLRALRWYGISYLAQAIFIAVLAQFTQFGPGALMLFLMRLFSGIIIPLDTYLLQRSTQPQLLGRVIALHMSTYGGVMQISYAFIGLAFEHVGVPIVGLLIGAISLACGCFWLFQMRVMSQSL